MTMTTTIPAVPSTTAFIRSRKHGRAAAPCLAASVLTVPALALLATLAAPLAYAESANKDIEANTARRDVIKGDRRGIAPTVTFGLTGPTKAILSYYHMQSSEIRDTGIPFNNPFASGANVARNGDGTPIDVARETFYGLVNRDFRDIKTDIGTVDLRYELGNNLVLRNVTRFGKSKNDVVWIQPDDSKGNTVLYGTVWRRAKTRVTDTETMANATSLSGNLNTGGINHSDNTGVEISRESTGRSAYLFTPGTSNPLTNTFTCPSAGAATLYNCAPLNIQNLGDKLYFDRVSSPHYAGVGPGRSASLTANLKF